MTVYIHLLQPVPRSFPELLSFWLQFCIPCLERHGLPHIHLLVDSLFGRIWFAILPLLAESSLEYGDNVLPCSKVLIVENRFSVLRTNVPHFQPVQLRWLLVFSKHCLNGHQ